MTVSLAPRVAVKRPAEELRALAEQGNVELGSLTEHKASAAEVITWVLAATTTGASSTAESQNVRSARATEGGNGSIPTMLRKCV